MGYARRKQENVSRADRDVPMFAVVDDLQGHVTLELVEKFLAHVDVIVLSRIRAADDHHDEVTIFPNYLISDRWLEQMPVFIDPALEIERSQLVSFRHTFFGSVKNLNASRPPSRPTPESFTPPKGVRRSRNIQQLIQTMPL